MSQAETKRGCDRHLRFRCRVQNCQGSLVQIKPLFNKPLFVHSACGLWGTGDKGSIKEGHILPFWTKINWEQALKLTELHWCQRPPTQTETLELFPTAPGRISVCLFSSFPATASIQLGYSKLHGDAAVYKPPLDAFTRGWQLLNCSTSLPPCYVIALDYYREELFYFGFFCQHTIITFFILQLAHYITYCLVTEEEAVPTPSSFWFKEGRQAKVSLWLPFCNWAPRQAFYLGSHKNLTRSPVAQDPKHKNRLPLERDFAQLLFPGCPEILYFIALWIYCQWLHPQI